MLEVDPDTLQEAIVENNTMNYHDRYFNIARQMNIPLDALLQNAFSTWLKEPDNKNLAELFIFSIINHNKKHSSTMEYYSEKEVKFKIDDREIIIARDNILHHDKIPLINGMKLTFQLFFNSDSFIAKITAD